MPKARTYDAYVDGSAFLRNSFRDDEMHGIGGIIVDRSNHRLNKWFAHPVYGDGHSSFSDEVYAVAHALRIVPNESIVVVHSDLKAISQSAGHMQEWANSQAHAMNAAACRELVEATLLHRSVELRYIRKRDSHRWHRAAHTLAQAAALAQDVDLKFIFKESGKGGTKTPQNRGASKGSRKNRNDFAIHVSAGEQEQVFE